MIVHQEWTDRLSDYLDGELSADERGAVEAHLRGCGSCAAVLEDLKRVVARCLEKQRDQRYGDAAALAVALAPFGSDDARLSLGRITGLLRQRNSTPTSVARGLASDDETLQVTPEAAAEPRDPHAAGAPDGTRGVDHRGR